MKYFLVICIILMYSIAYSDCLTDEDLTDIAKDYFYIESCDHTNFNSVLGDILYYSITLRKKPAIMINIYTDADKKYAEIAKNIDGLTVFTKDMQNE